MLAISMSWSSHSALAWLTTVRVVPPNAYALSSTKRIFTRPPYRPAATTVCMVGRVSNSE
jgi:hypothetical protein